MNEGDTLDTISILAADAVAPTTLPGFDPLSWMTSISGTAGLWYGAAIAAGVGASILATIALLAVSRMKRGLKA